MIEYTTLVEPEPKLQYTGSGSGQKFRLLAAPAPAQQHCIRGLEIIQGQEMTSDILQSVQVYVNYIYTAYQCTLTVYTLCMSVR
jgi:hypothetical protein